MNIQKRMYDFHVPGVGVSYFEDAKIKWSAYWGTHEKDTTRLINNQSIFHACSISKMITALCVLRLAQDDILDLHKEANQYLKSWKIPDNDFTKEKKISLLSLLSHQAGFYDIDGSFEPYKNGDDIPKTIDMLKGITQYNNEEVCPKYIPETEFAYSDAGYCVIEQIIEDITGETIEQIAERLIFNPLALKSTFFWEIGKEKEFDLNNCVAGHDSDGNVVEEIRARYPNIGGATLWSTPDELSRIVIDIIKAYNEDAGIILNKEMAKFMLTPYGCVDFIGMGVFLNSENGMPYFFSQGWGVGMQCKLRAYYLEKRGVVVMTNSEPGMEQDKALIGEIINEVCKNGSI